MHVFWTIVGWLFILGTMVTIGVFGVWGMGRGNSNVGNIFGENAKSHWYAKDHDNRKW